jgi:hypothetical protein
VLQNDDNNDDIWEPQKIPLRISESIQKCTGTKYHPVETQKKESGFLPHTITYSQNIFFIAPLLLRKFFQITGKKINLSLAVSLLLKGHLYPVALIASAKFKLG